MLTNKTDKTSTVKQIYFSWYSYALCMNSTLKKPNLTISFIRGFKLENKKQAYFKKRKDKKNPLSVKVTKLFKYTVNNEARNKHGTKMHSLPSNYLGCVFCRLRLILSIITIITHAQGTRGCLREANSYNLLLSFHNKTSQKFSFRVSNMGLDASQPCGPASFQPSSPDNAPLPQWTSVTRARAECAIGNI